MSKRFATSFNINPTAIRAAARLWSAEQRKMDILKAWARRRDVCRAGLRALASSRSPSWAMASLVGTGVAASWWFADENNFWLPDPPMPAPWLCVVTSRYEWERHLHHLLLRHRRWADFFSEVTP